MGKAVPWMGMAFLVFMSIMNWVVVGMQPECDCDVKVCVSVLHSSVVFEKFNCKCLKHRKIKDFCAVGLNWMLLEWRKMFDFLDCSVEWYKYCDLISKNVLKILYFQWFSRFVAADNGNLRYSKIP